MTPPTPPTPAAPRDRPRPHSRWPWAFLAIGLAAAALARWVAPAPVPKNRTDAAELEKLAGLWVFESRTLGGRPLSVDNPSARWEVKDGYLVQPDSGVAYGLELDPSADPKRMTMTEARVKNGRPVTVEDGTVQRAVYALDGDTLTITVGYGPEADYPQAVTPKLNDPVLSMVYKRVKN